MSFRDLNSYGKVVGQAGGSGAASMAAYLHASGMEPLAPLDLQGFDVTTQFEVSKKEEKFVNDIIKARKAQEIQQEQRQQYIQYLSDRAQARTLALRVVNEQAQIFQNGTSSINDKVQVARSEAMAGHWPEAVQALYESKQIKNAMKLFGPGDFWTTSKVPNGMYNPINHPRHAQHNYGAAPYQGNRRAREADGAGGYLRPLAGPFRYLPRANP